MALLLLAICFLSDVSQAKRFSSMSHGNIHATLGAHMVQGNEVQANASNTSMNLTSVPTLQKTKASRNLFERGCTAGQMCCCQLRYMFHNPPEIPQYHCGCYGSHLELPPGWQRGRSKSGQIYYIEPLVGIKSVKWEPPTGLSYEFTNCENEGKGFQVKKEDERYQMLCPLLGAETYGS
eukprot:gnl/MRDRNA2_/MRDRNA2_216689_c0_seq1.p1 gnl/MRDRNA2_/MRDRNA2_216689_c0~~gnl/MRDRNA2_/MRDRNA2_216689_c0_seq1.p1  ORF type:complete len:179 (+),score=5.91 gnl/MRDRNA2_/MRDRNA2_216689_c0_seq1:98-634(+)